MIEDLLAAGLSEDEIVRRVMAALGVSEETARFMVGIVSGGIVGDFVEVDADGTEHKPTP